MGGVWAGYSRVSRVGDRAERLISPELQQQRITEYAGGRGIDVELLEPELDVSGGDVERPILDQVLDGIEDGRYSGIIVAQLDRLSRMDILDAVQTVRKIEAAGGTVISVAENFDATTPEGQMGRNVMLAVADMQLGRYKLQFSQAKRRAVENGIWPNSTVAIGYTVTPRKAGGDGRLKVDPPAAAKVRKAFEQRAAENTWNVVARTLGMGASGAMRVISNRVYLGEIRHGDLVNPTAHEPIVDLDLFERANRALGPRPPRSRLGPRASLLTGLVRCGGCSHAMSPTTDKDGVWIYRCMSRVKASGKCASPALVAQHLVDEHVQAVVLPHLRAIGYDAQARGRALQEAEEKYAAAVLEREAYQQAVSVSELGVDKFLAGMRSRDEAVAAGDRERRAARAAAMPSIDAGELLDLWDDLTVEERGHVLRGTLSVVWVRKGRRNIAARTRIIAAGYGPEKLSRGGRGGPYPIEPVDWPDGDLPGELRLPSA